MKFSDIEQEKWQGLKPYLDTAVLPITGLTGLESPDEATMQLELLRDWLDSVEQPFNGRIVTYPAYHFVASPLQQDGLNSLIENFKLQGFKHVVAVTAKHNLALERYPFDAIIAPTDVEQLPIYENVSLMIMKMWTK